MTVTSILSGDLFILSVEKSPIGALSDVWVNTYEFRARADLSNPQVAIENLMDTVVGFERGFHLNVVQFNQARFSTWQVDTNPYNADEFYTVPRPAGTTGNRDPATDTPLDLQVVLYVRRSTFAGRTGKLHYRGCLTETDVDYVAGEFVLDGASGIVGAFDSSLVVNNPLIHPDFEMVMIGVNSAAEVYVRPVTDLQVAGVRITRRDHRYFDRAP